MKKATALLIPLFLLFTGCGQDESNSNSDSDSMAQQVGDTMAAIDGAGGSDGGYAMIKTEYKTYARLKKKHDTFGFTALFETLLPRATAATCSNTNTFGACSSNVITRDFQNCTIGAATFSGNVTLTFDDGTTDNTCTVDSDGDTITRNPNFTITGGFGGQFAVSKVGTIGQRITRVSAGVFQFINDGIRRTLSFNGNTRADFTTATTSAIGLTGVNRNGRVANGGTLRVTDNLDSSTCDFTPNAVTWESNCNCATSGTWSVSCSNGDSATFSITGCGTGTIDTGDEAGSYTLDQCSTQ